MSTTDAQRQAVQQWVRDFADLILVGASDGLDIADVMAAGLATAAREMGGIHQVIAGRPGSWESALVVRLAEGALGPTNPSPTDWATGH